MLVRGPGNGLYCSIVIAELDHRRGGVEVPDVQLVVIATAGNLPVIWRPLQATDLHAHGCLGDENLCSCLQCLGPACQDALVCKALIMHRTVHYIVRRCPFGSTQAF